MKKILMGLAILATQLYSVDTELNMGREVDSWYIGADVGLIDFDGSLEVDRGSGFRNINSNKDIKSSPLRLKWGFLQEQDNRLEFYYKNDSVDVNQELFSTDTVGVKSEWGFSSLSTKNMLPYFALGFGLGKSSSSYREGEDGKVFNNGVVIELDLNLGLHYKIYEKIDISTNIFRKNILNMISDAHKNNEGSADYSVLATFYGMEIGFSYYF